MSQFEGQNIRFSSAELSLLKDINRVQEAANVVTSILKLSPFIQFAAALIPTSPSSMATDIAVTIDQTDWNQIENSVKAMGQIEACKVKQLIDLWSIDDSFSSSATERFFSAISSTAEDTCQT